jgi:hypothetical protein
MGALPTLRFWKGQILRKPPLRLNPLNARGIPSVVVVTTRVTRKLWSGPSLPGTGLGTRSG